MATDIGAEFVAVDWGTTHLRLRLIRAFGSGALELLAETQSRDGIASVAAGEHERVFLAALRGLAGDRESPVRDVYFAGMVTSSLGWVPTPYVSTPCGARELAAGLTTRDVGSLRLHFLPGVRTQDDVLRGEEVEALGLLTDAFGWSETVLVLPGTHSKWIHWRAVRIQDFVTVPTGDLHAGLHQATLLARTLPPAPVAVEGPLLADFDRGVLLAIRLGGLSALFRVRSLPVLDGLNPERASAMLSGILIAGEILERAPRSQGQPILVGGAPALQGLYLRAFGLLEIAACAIAAEASRLASVRGLSILRALRA